MGLERAEPGNWAIPLRIGFIAGKNLQVRRALTDPLYFSHVNPRLNMRLWATIPTRKD